MYFGKPYDDTTTKLERAKMHIRSIGEYLHLCKFACTRVPAIDFPQ